jgi:16S rRNA (cytosine967-C5)-methyltransferase
VPSLPSNVARGQAEVFRHLWRQLGPFAATDRAFPARLEMRLRQDRRFGSRDRRLYRELTYTALRYRSWLPEPGEPLDDTALAGIIWLSAEQPATRPLKQAITGDWPAGGGSVAERAAILQARGLARADRCLLPEWFRTECPEAFSSPLYDSLLQRAPLWLRLQTHQPERVETEFRERGWSFTPSVDLPSAWRVEGEVELTRSDAYAEGLIEVQDLGSQWIVDQLPLSPGERWLDGCAGAGGKSLHLACRLGSQGKVIAHDIRPEALTELQLRARRAGMRNIEVTPDPAKHAAASFDGVLVDAPCSGTGTWRRSPHLKWSTSPEHVAAYAAQQAALLERYHALVRPGGLLVYATCSLTHTENEDVIQRFRSLHPDFQPPAAPLRVLPRALPSAGGHTLLPPLYDTDGFYAAVLRRQ